MNTFSTCIDIIVGKKTVRPIGNVPPNSIAYGKANSIYCPLGKQPTECWLLILQKNLEVIEKDSSAEITLTWTESGEKRQNKLTYKKLYVVDTTSATDSAPTEPNSLYLLHLADNRYFCQNTNITLASNVRTIANEHEFLAGTTTRNTWAKLIESCWLKCPLLGAWPGLPDGFTPAGKPEGYMLAGHNAYDVLNEILEYLYCALCPIPAEGKFKIVQIEVEQQLNLDKKIAAGRRLVETRRRTSNRLHPEKIKYTFPVHYQAHGTQNDTEYEDNYYTTAGTKIYQLEKNTSISGATGELVIWEPMKALRSEDGTIWNTSDLDARAEERLAGYKRLAAMSTSHSVYSGILQDIIPGPKVAFVIWKNMTGATHTEFYIGAEPMKVSLSTELKSEVQAVKSGTAALYMPQDLMQYSSPASVANPVNSVKVVEWEPSGADSGKIMKELSPNGDGYFMGLVLKHSVSGEVEEDRCWIKVIDGTYPISLKMFRNQVFHSARLCGTATSGGVQKPLYTIRKGADPVMFGMTTEPIDIEDTGEVALGFVSGFGTPLPAGVGTFPDRFECFNAFGFVNENTPVAFVRWGEFYFIIAGRCEAPPE